MFAAFAVTAAYAGDAAEFLNHPGKVIVQPDLKELPGEPWQIAKGTWVAADGVLTPTRIEAEKHVPVLWDKISPASAVIECEFQFGTGSDLIIGCDAKKHIGRVSITPKMAKVTDDSTEVKGKVPATVLQQEKIDLKKDQWYSAKFGWKGDHIYAIVDGHELVGQAPTFTQTRARWWFASAGGVHIRNVRVSEGK